MKNILFPAVAVAASAFVTVASAQTDDEVEGAYKLCQRHVIYSSTKNCSTVNPGRCIQTPIGFEDGFHDSCTAIEAAWAKHLTDVQAENRKRAIDDVAGKLKPAR